MVPAQVDQAIGELTAPRREGLRAVVRRCLDRPMIQFSLRTFLVVVVLAPVVIWFAVSLAPRLIWNERTPQVCISKSRNSPQAGFATIMVELRRSDGTLETYIEREPFDGKLDEVGISKGDRWGFGARGNVIAPITPGMHRRYERLLAFLNTKVNVEGLQFKDFGESYIRATKSWSGWFELSRAEERDLGLHQSDFPPGVKIPGYVD